MIRTTEDGYDANANGTGRSGYKDTGPNPTTVGAAPMNHIQEEIARTIELSGGTLSSGSKEQLYAAINTMILTYPRPMARLHRTTTQSISTGGSGTAIDFDVVTHQIGGSNAPVASASSNDITISLSGIYRITIQGGATAPASPTAGSSIGVYMYVNGSVTSCVSASPAVGNADVALCASTEIALVNGDVITMKGIHGTGSSITYFAQMSLAVSYVGPSS